MKRTLVSAAALVIGLGGGMGGLHGVAHAQGGTPVTCGSAIVAPGEYYLASDCTGYGITITSSDVHLMLDGHTMTGTSYDSGITADDVTNVRIEGPGTITGYDGAVSFYDVTDSHVWKVVGIFYPYAAAIFDIDRGSSGNLFNDDTSIGGELGFWIFRANNNELVHDEAKGTSSVGIFLTYASGNDVESSQAHDNGVQGVGLYDSSGNTIAGTDASNNGQNGIWLRSGSSGNAIHGNTAYNNGTFDLEDDNPNCDSNNWEGNHFVTTNQPQCVS